MKKNKFAIVLFVLAMAGCQAAQVEVKEHQQQQPELAVPYSKGPTTEPKVNAPATTPAMPSAANALTEKENIRLTLPVKNAQ